MVLSSYPVQVRLRWVKEELRSEEGVEVGEGDLGRNVPDR
jgi:hypothetical protein